MKVLIVCTVPFDTNGIVSVIMNYYGNMKNSEIQFDFAVHSAVNDTYKKMIEKNHDRVIVFPNRKKQSVSYIRKLRKLLKKENYDIMHVHGNSAMMEIELFAAQGLDVKKIVHAHNTQCTYQVFHKLLYKKFMKSYDYALACSTAAGEWLYKNAHFRIFNNAIHAEKFTYSPQVREEVREELGLKQELVLGHVGLFVRAKNHRFMLAVLKELLKQEENVILLLIGDGELKREIEELSEQMGIKEHIKFLGKSQRVPEYMQAMDIFIMPSFHEGLPLVGIEAQAAGLPCVFSEQVTRELQHRRC